MKIPVLHCVFWGAQLTYRSGWTFPYSLNKEKIVVQCVVRSMRLRNFPATIRMKYDVLQCALWDVSLGYSFERKRSFSSVYSGMSVQIGPSSETPLAHITWKTPFTVSESFNFTTLLSGQFGTRFTTRSFSVTCTFTTREIIVTRECFLACLAGIRALFVEFLWQSCPLFTKRLPDSNILNEMCWLHLI
jgi:hypothetical protein